MGEGWERGVVHICIASVVHYIIIYFASDGSFGCTYRVGKRSSGSGYGILRWLPLYNTEIQTVDHSDYRVWSVSLSLHFKYFYISK